MQKTSYRKRTPRNVLFILGLAGALLLLALLATSGGKQAANAAPLGAQSADGIWQDVAEASLRVAGDRVIVPTAYRTVSLDWDELNAILAQAPASINNSDVVLFLPLPDGAYGRFQIHKTSVMHPELAAKFPEIQTFAGVGIDDQTAYVRLDSTPKGFHAMILSGNGRVFIDPYSNDDIGLYQSYYANDFIPNLPEDFDPDVVVEDPANLIQPEGQPTIDGAFASGGELRTYRLAVAATGEYTEFHGGTVPLAMAEIVTAINRVAGIYEREVAVTFQLIPNNDLIIYTNGATDPYTNSNGSVMLGQNQSNLNSVIGAANYDVGHVFSTGGGGIAGLGVVCGSGKAQGVTGLSAPIGDPFYVDYVSHEMGHQFAGNHTFNGNAGSCGGFNRNSSTAYEPGSGTTIMAYAGICDPQNVQNNSDDYFHGISFDEIVSFTTAGAGNSCAAVSSTGNTPPTADAGASYSIPLNTPFTLTGSGSDVDGTASLTYNWEEFDLGPTGSPLSPLGNAPIFRSFGPTTSPARTFPQISDIVNNTQTLGELLPSYGRTMNFRFTVRDNQAPAGGVASDETTVTAVDGTGPFLVTAPNTAVIWASNTTQTITWNVAGTNLAPISCANVDISLSSDGGFTYDTVLATNTPNDGSADIVVPNFGTNIARIRVACTDNIFFDISNVNFTIQPGGGPTVTPSNTPIPPTPTNTPTSTATATASPTPGPGGEILVFNPVADAFTIANRPNGNLGGASALRLDAAPENNSYLRFDVQGVSSTVSQATLRLYVQSSSSLGYDVHQVADNSWGELSINFNNAPALGSVINSSGATTANSFVDVDVTSFVTGNGLVSFGVSTADSSLILLASRESGNPPELIVEAAGSGGPPTLSVIPDCASGPDVQFDVLGSNWPVEESVTLSFEGVEQVVLQANQHTGNFQLTWTFSGLADGVYTVSGLSGINGDTASAIFTIPCDGGPTATPTPTNTATPTNTPTFTPTPRCDVEFEGDAVAGNNFVFVTGDVGIEVTVINLTTGVTLGSSVLPGPFDGHACPGFGAIILEPPLDSGDIGNLLLVVETGVPDNSDTTIVVGLSPTSTPTATATASPTPGPGGSTFTFTTSDDAIVLSNRATSNYGAATILGTDDSPDILSYLKFNVAGLDGPVASATLRVFVSTAAAPFDVAEVADNGWSQASITYSNAPATGTIINGSGAISGGTWVEIDVTSFISGDGTFSLALLPDGIGRNLFDSTETGNGPELVVVTGP